MALFKCKMCGGSLDITNNETVFDCEYCGSRQTLPRLDDEKKVSLYDRANHFRRNNDYDKAMGIYEQILNEDSSDAEAYWSLVLCKYGIEYVEDPTSHKRIPTVNRAQYTSIYDDVNYKAALEHADSLQKAVYEEEAKYINEIQKGILEISQNEESFDVFICYKETDENGRRTQDSVLANDLYHQLTQEGLKVFFARITLEDKIGTAYEPYIFAALNSAKAMVVIGTKPEYFNAVWVKNEWSRYLALIKQGEKKILIPAYRDMDPYNLPDEFSHLQAQDMGKLGFMQDLIRGIKKITGVDEPKPTVIREVVAATPAGANVANLVKRMYLELEDGNWDKAKDKIEDILDMDPECADAYVGKLMIDLNIRIKSKITKEYETVCNNPNYKKIMRFANDDIKKEFANYEKEYKNSIKEQSYVTAKQYIEPDKIKKLNNYKDVKRAFEKAINVFNSLSDYKDSKNLAEQCEKDMKEYLYNYAKKLMNSNSGHEGTYAEARTVFGFLNNYMDSKELAIRCEELAKEAKLETEYNNNIFVMKNTVDVNRLKTISIFFKNCEDYKESKEYYNKCVTRIEKIKKAEILHTEETRKDKILQAAKNKAALGNIENYKEVIPMLESIPGWKDADSLLDKYKKIVTKDLNQKRLKKYSIIIGVSVFIIFIFVLVMKNIVIPSNKYKKALSMMNNENYLPAISEFKELGGYKRSEYYRTTCEYNLALQFVEKGWFDEALHIFENIKDYGDSYQKIAEINKIKENDIEYNRAISMMDSGHYSTAISVFEKIPDYRDSAEKIRECKYKIAITMMEKNDNYGAVEVFKEIIGYKDSEEKLNSLLELQYNDAIKLMNTEKYQEAINYFVKMNGYKDSNEKIKECEILILDGKYNEALGLLTGRNYIEAYETLVSLDGYKDSKEKAESIYFEYCKEKIKNAKVGDYITLGSYEQDNNVDNGKENIEWLLLDIKEGNALLLSKYVLDAAPYDSNIEEITWENCELRKWLNTTFAESAFSKNEESLIITADVPADKNPEYGTSSGNPTQDKIFLLSIEEAKRYFDSDKERQWIATRYAESAGAYRNNNGVCWMWLRTPGSDQSRASGILDDGTIDERGFEFGASFANGKVVVTDEHAVRPAMWINLNS